MNRIKVLWLDDDFAPVNLNEDKGVQIRKKNFQDTAEDAVEYGIYFDKVLTLQEFVNKLETVDSQYDAVILDILGLNPNDSTDEKIMYEALKVIEKYRDLLCYVFSNNINRHKPYLETNWSGHYFEKCNSAKLFNKIKEDISSKNIFYKDKDYLRECVQNGWIDKYVKDSYLDALMHIYVDKDIDRPWGNYMRNLIVPMLERIVTEYEKEPKYKEMLTKKGKDDTGRPSDIAINLAKLDPSSRLMEGALLHMVKATNSQSHLAIDDEDRLLFFESDFNTFFLVCKWFYKKMCEFSTLQIYGNTANTSLQQENTSPVKTTPVLQVKKYNSIPVRVNWENKDKPKLDINVELPNHIKKEKPAVVHVIRIIPSKRNPSIWFADIDDNKPYDLEDDKFPSSTYSLEDKLLEAFNKKK